VDPLLANTVKQNVTRFVYQVGRLTHDIAGGLLSTLPSDAGFPRGTTRSEACWRSTYRREAGVLDGGQEEAVPVHRGMTSVSTLVEALHGAGSPQAQRIVDAPASGPAGEGAPGEKVIGLGKDGK